MKFFKIFFPIILIIRFIKKRNNIVKLQQIYKKKLIYFDFYLI
jgi:hypothetical protein